MNKNSKRYDLVLVTLIALALGAGCVTGTGAGGDGWGAGEQALQVVTAPDIDALADGESLRLDLTPERAAYLFDLAAEPIDFGRVLLVTDVGELRMDEWLARIANNTGLDPLADELEELLVASQDFDAFGLGTGVAGLRTVGRCHVDVQTGLMFCEPPR